MSKKGGSAPTPPDPSKTASAQTGTNVATAQANALMNMVNQITPQGNLTYSQSGSNFISDPNGQNYWVGPNGQYQTSAPAMVGGTTGGAPGGAPAGSFAQQQALARAGAVSGGVNTMASMQRLASAAGGAGGSAGSIPAGWSQQKGYYVPSYTATQTLSPGQQKIYDQSTAAQGNLAALANDRSQWLDSYLKQAGPQAPTLESTNLTRDKVEQSLLERLQPSLDAYDRSNQVSLANKGIQAGSTAYGRGRQEVSTNSNDARLAAIAQAGDEQTKEYGNLLNEYAAKMQQRNQPLNEIAQLLGLSQTQSPSYVNTPQTNMPTVDYAGLVNENYNQKMQAYQMKQAQSQQLMGGLLGLGSSFLMSDRRTKTDIKKVGELDSGLPVYSYRYKHGGPTQIGVMAQEVEKVRPDAVAEFGGVKHVDYGKVS